MLNGRAILVTGAGRNLGRQIALDAARRGAAVGVNVRSDTAAAEAVVETIRSEGGTAIPVFGDVTDPDRVREMVSTCRDELGPVTMLVHCAVNRSAHGPIESSSPDDWKRSIAVALDGAFLCIRELLEDMVSAEFGRIILIGGSSSHLGLPLGSAHAATAKSGFDGLVRAVAQEYGRRGVTANVVSCGGLLTERTRQLAHADAEGWNSVAFSTIGRLIDLGEVSALVLALCGPAGAIVT
jgi:3-oxoacyl-[acyl-carrier protein] reductase